MIFALDLLATLRLETFICYPVCYQMVGWGPVVRPGAQSQGPCRLVPAGAGALHQLAHEAAEAGRVFVPSSLRHRLSQGPRGRRHATRKGHSACEGVHDLGPSGAEPLRARRVAVPRGCQGRGGSGAPRGRSPAEIVPPSDFPAGDSRMRVLRRGRRTAGGQRGTGGGASGPRETGPSAADERARVRSARPEERGPGRPLVRPDRSALRNGRYGPRDEADETHGALKGARPSGWMRSPTPGNPDASSVPHPHERWWSAVRLLTSVPDPFPTIGTGTAALQLRSLSPPAPRDRTSTSASGPAPSWEHRSRLSPPHEDDLGLQEDAQPSGQA